MKKSLMIAAAVLALLTGTAHADSKDGVTKATLVVAVTVQHLKCDSEPSDNAILIAKLWTSQKAYSDKQLKTAITQQAALIETVGLKTWCGLVEGQMALMDKNVSEALAK